MVIFCICNIIIYMKLTIFFTAFDTKITFSLGLLSAYRHREIERVVSNGGKSH